MTRTSAALTRGWTLILALLLLVAPGSALADSDFALTPHPGNPVQVESGWSPRGLVRHGESEYRLFLRKWTQNTPGDFKVLVSTDGVDWQASGGDSLLGWSQSAGDYNSRLCELKTQDTYRLYLDGGAFFDPNFINSHPGTRLEYSQSDDPGFFGERQTLLQYPNQGGQAKLYGLWAVEGLDGDHLFYNASDPSRGGFGNGDIVHALVPLGTLEVQEMGVVISRGEAGSFDDQKVEKPVVFFDGRQFEMFYSAQSSQEIQGAQSHLGHAVSADGQDWQKTGMVEGSSGLWEVEGVVKNQDGSYGIWYQQSGVEGLCFASLPVREWALDQ